MQGVKLEKKNGIIFYNAHVMQGSNVECPNAYMNVNFLSSEGLNFVAIIFFYEKENCRSKHGNQKYNGILKAVEICDDFI